MTDPLTRSILVGVQIVLETADPELGLAAIAGELEAAVVLPPELVVDGATVTVVGARTEAVLEVAVPPAPTGGAYGR
jgi:hypothetical protein